ncbi:hypothetical protein [Nonomuraea sp. JJY05]|uniref:hypothetical protein n=1 Tax=Nonomuraea sp. JJY05 TaxID=3350255 RepID=UPI00373EC430
MIGPLTDRFDRRRLRIACDLGSVVPVGGLLVAFHTGSVAPALGCLAVLSVFAAVAGPIPEAALPNLVTGRDLPPAQTMLGSLYSAGAGRHGRLRRATRPGPAGISPSVPGLTPS